MIESESEYHRLSYRIVQYTAHKGWTKLHAGSMEYHYVFF